MSAWFARLLLSASTLLACGGDPGQPAVNPPDAGPASSAAATGSVRGTPVRLTSAYAYYRSVSGQAEGLPYTDGVLLSLATAADTCTTRFPATRNATNFIVAIAGQPAPIGDYTMLDDTVPQATLGPMQADVLFQSTDATCVEQPPDGATTGTISITASDATHLAGTFDITFGPDDAYHDGHVTGTFDAPICSPGEKVTFSSACQ